jgi:dimethylargininase
VKHAIVREPSKSYFQCISTHPLSHNISVGKAQLQHRQYCEILTNLGIDLIKLDPDEKYPDSCFVEDTAVIYGKKALISRMGAVSRRGEEQSIAAVLKSYLSVKQVDSPGTIEGGDVILFPNYLLSGLTQRTNIQGAQALQEWLEIDVQTIEAPEIIHLKSHVTYLEGKTLIMNNRFVDHPAFVDFNKIIVTKQESYAANTLTINGTVIVPTNHPNVVKKLKENGYEVITTEMSEFEKCEGALTCLSLLF